MCCGCGVVVVGGVHAMQTMQTLQRYGRTRLRSISPPKTDRKSRSNSPPKKDGCSLRITIVEAKNLAAKEDKMPASQSAHQMALTFVDMNTNDPYCKVSVGKKHFKTSHKCNTLNPKWNETFLL